MPPRPRSPAGPTRLDFALVVVLAGVLLAVALPRWQATRAEARAVRLKMLLATAQTSASLFHGRCAIVQATTPDERCERLTLQGATVAGVHGWPSAGTGGIAAALKPWDAAADIDWQPETVDGVPALRARLKPVSAVGTCEFIYAQAASPGATPRIALVDVSCP
jgi:type II secretory pathway pseudopilin PulG